MVPTAPEALLTAIRGRDRATIERMLRDDPALSTQRAAGGESLVLHACYLGAAELAPLLLHGRKPDAPESAALGDVTALRSAIEMTMMPVYVAAVMAGRHCISRHSSVRSMPWHYSSITVHHWMR